MANQTTTAEILAKNIPMILTGTIAIVGIIAVTTVAVVRPGDQSINLLLLFVGTMVTQILGNKYTADKVDAVHDSVNGKMEKLLSVTKELGHKEGVAEEKAASKEPAG